MFTFSSLRVCLAALFATAAVVTAPQSAAADPLHTTYMWHLHQPIYYPEQRSGAAWHYEDAWDTIQAQNGGRVHPSDILSTIFGVDDREAAYQYRVRDSLNSIRWATEAGVQVNMSGALIENVNSLAGRQSLYYNGWQGSFQEGRNWTATHGKTRMDMVNFTYHHSLAPFLTPDTFDLELKLHRRMMELNWGNTPAQSRGYFPTETCFAEYMIPILKRNNIEWSVISGNHLSRAVSNFPLTLGSGGENCEPPNRADQLNPAQSNWFALTIDRGCTPRNAYPFAYTPHRAQFVDPNTGTTETLVVVPAAQEFSWQDGYSPFSPNVFDTVAAGNNPSRPMLIMLSHDGDNAYAGGYSYYMQDTPNFVNAAVNKGYIPSTVEQYLHKYPVPNDAIVKVETGGWVNADSDFGSPTMINWLYPLLNSAGQPDPVNGWHEKSREYAIFMATENYVRSAQQKSGTSPRLDHILNPNAASTQVEQAWHFYLGSLDSGNVYYGTPGDMEIRSTVGCNHALTRAQSVLSGGFTDQTTPTVFIPQRWPYNPGGLNFGVATQYTQKTFGPDFTVWTFVADVGGIANVNLKWRVDGDGVNPLASGDNETYAGGDEVGAWNSIAMDGRLYPSGNIYNKGEINYSVLPTQIAHHYSGTIVGQSSKLIDYYVEATDNAGNVTRSPIQHVWVGSETGPGGGGGGPNPGSRVSILPTAPTAGQPVTIFYNAAGGVLAGANPVRLHWGVNNWASVQTGSPYPAMTFNALNQLWETTVTIPNSATQLDMVFNNGGGTWDNNGGADWHYAVSGGAPPPPPAWTLDGIAETTTIIRTETPSGLKLWVTSRDGVLYVGTNRATSGRDHFIYITSNTAAMRSAQWAKGGQVVQWDAMLANEESNGWNGWFNGAGGVDFTGIASSIAGAPGTGVLEGTINLDTLYAGMPAAKGPKPMTPGKAAATPATIYVAAAAFGTNDGGTLDFASQAPPTTNSNGNLDATEFIPLASNVPVQVSEFILE